MQNQQFCLKWNNHQNNMLRVFGRLLSNESLTDVTLCCEGRSVRVHKMVLSACSAYFEQLFLEHNESSPLLIILKDTPFSDLTSVIDFMYKGEVNVSQENLNSLLRTAENLRIKGLSDVALTSPSMKEELNIQNPTPLPAHSNPPHPFPVSSPPPPQPLLALATNPIHSMAPNLPASTVITKAHLNNANNAASSPPLSTSSAMDPPQAMANDPATVAADWNAALARKRGRPRKKRYTSPHSQHPTDPDQDSSFHLRIDNVTSITENSYFNQEDDDLLMNPSDALDLSVSESHHPLKLDHSRSPEAESPVQPTNGFYSNTLAQLGEEPSGYFKGLSIYRYDYYTLRGTRQQFWEEPFTHAVMAAVHEREMDLKEGAKLLGVSYGTLYGRYREVYGYLKHTWGSSRGRKRDALGSVSANPVHNNDHGCSGEAEETESGEAETAERENDSNPAIPAKPSLGAVAASTTPSTTNAKLDQPASKPTLLPKPVPLVAPLQIIKICKKEQHPGEPDQHYVTPHTHTADTPLPFKKLRKLMIKPVLAHPE